MREPLADVTVVIDGTPAASSTTIAAAGGYVLVLATALPDHGVTLTSCYLSRPAGAIATSHLQLGPRGHERLAQHIVAAGQLHATVAGACLLDHAAELQNALTAHSDAAHVSVDVGLAALARAASAWGPPHPHP